tara:strand:+ start:1506 stop:1658 length:153 start_codon:yes stop_codon:yes gene_type:complete
MGSAEKSVAGGNGDYYLKRTDLFKERLEAGSQLWGLALLTSVQEVVGMLP